MVIKCCGLRNSVRPLPKPPDSRPLEKTPKHATFSGAFLAEPSWVCSKKRLLVIVVEENGETYGRSPTRLSPRPPPEPANLRMVVSGIIVVERRQRSMFPERCVTRVAMGLGKIGQCFDLMGLAQISLSQEYGEEGKVGLNFCQVSSV